MSLLRTKNTTLSKIISVVERLDSNAQSAVLNNLKKLEITLKAKRLDASVKGGKKPSIEEIVASVRKVRTRNAKKKA